MSRADFKFGNADPASVAGRVADVLRGRAPFRWATWVGLSNGTMSRLKEGGLPDPEKLAPACRAENLSLTWLVDGLGAPYLVHVVTNEDDAAHAIEQLLGEEAWSVLLVACRTRATIVLHQQASIELKRGRCDYTATAIVSGCYDASAVVRTIGGNGLPPRIVHFDQAQWWRLATGHMSATELFGWPDEPGGLARLARAYDPADDVVDIGKALNAVREYPPARYDDELVRLANALEPADREVVLRMLRGLSQA
jgi:hypothetical protein